MVKRYGAIVHPQEMDEAWLRRMKDAGLNVLGLHPEGGKDADRTLRNLIEDTNLPERKRLYRMAQEMGIEIEFEMHVLSYLLPRRLFDVHPEWFRMNTEGERVADFNFCVSNEEALAYVADRAALLAQILRPTTDKYYFWLDDVQGYRCNCEKCRELSPSDLQLTCVNAMLEGVRKINPKAKMAYIAYQDAMQVPQKVKPVPGVFLEYAPIYRDSSIPINDSTCEKNVKEAAPIDALLEFFGKEDSQVLEYWVDNSRYSKWTRPPKYMPFCEDVMRSDVPFYKKKGFESITSFACFLGADYVELFGEPPIKDYGEVLHAGE